MGHSAPLCVGACASIAIGFSTTVSAPAAATKVCRFFFSGSAANIAGSCCSSASAAASTGCASRAHRCSGCSCHEACIRLGGVFSCQIFLNLRPFASDLSTVSSVCADPAFVVSGSAGGDGRSLGSASVVPGRDILRLVRLQSVLAEMAVRARSHGQLASVQEVQAACETLRDLAAFRSAGRVGASSTGSSHTARPISVRRVHQARVPLLARFEPLNGVVEGAVLISRC